MLRPKQKIYESVNLKGVVSKPKQKLFNPAIPYFSVVQIFYKVRSLSSELNRKLVQWIDCVTVQ